MTNMAAGVAAGHALGRSVGACIICPSVGCCRRQCWCGWTAAAEWWPPRSPSLLPPLTVRRWSRSRSRPPRSRAAAAPSSAVTAGWSWSWARRPTFRGWCRRRRCRTSWRTTCSDCTRPAANVCSATGRTITTLCCWSAQVSPGRPGLWRQGGSTEVRDNRRQGCPGDMGAVSTIGSHSVIGCRDHSRQGRPGQLREAPVIIDPRSRELGRPAVQTVAGRRAHFGNMGAACSRTMEL